MKNIKEKVESVALLFLFWMLLSMELTFTNITTGIFASVMILFVADEFAGSVFESGVSFKYTIKAIKYVLIVFFQIYESSFIHIKRIIEKDCNPFIAEVHLETSNPFIVTVISNSITLTPGTITVDTDKNKIYVLSMKDDNMDGKMVETDIKHRLEKLLLGDD